MSEQINTTPPELDLPEPVDYRGTPQAAGLYRVEAVPDDKPFNRDDSVVFQVPGEEGLEIRGHVKGTHKEFEDLKYVLPTGPLSGHVELQLHVVADENMHHAPRVTEINPLKKD